MNIRAFIISLGLIFLCACSGDETQKKACNWPQELKDKMVNDCFAEAINHLDSLKALESCNCVLEKMMAAHPDTVDVRAIGREKIKRESMKKALSCMF